MERPTGVASAGQIDAFGHDVALAPVASLLAARQTPTPLSVGIFAGPGAGKSSALARLTDRVAQLCTAGGPNVSGVAIASLRASDIVGAPTSALAECLRLSLAQTHLDLAQTAARASVDPHVAMREATQALDAARDRLEIERKGLDALEARRSALVDTLVNENTGSNLDNFARANRSTIETRLRGFGFGGDNLVASFKELARDALDQPGVLGAVGAFLHACLNMRKQKRLLFWAALLFLAAIGAEASMEDPDMWTRRLGPFAEQAAPVLEWLQAHKGFWSGLKFVLNGLALLCVAINLTRAFRFVAPIRRAAQLLRADIEARRGQIETAMAHQSRRVDSLSRDVERHAAHVVSAEQRAASAPGGSSLLDEVANPTAVATARATQFVGTLASAIGAGDAAAPGRVLVVIDDLDAVAAARAAEIMGAAHELLARPGFVLIVGVDAARLASAFASPSDAAANLDRWIQIPVRLTPTGGDFLGAYARGLLTGEPIAASPEAPRSADDAISADEAALVSALTPLAAATPRAAYRFAGVYRLCRARGADRPALALACALDCGATSAELGAVHAAMDRGDDGAPLIFTGDQDRLRLALEATNKARGAPLTIGAARAAWAIARDYGMPM